jgi:putative ABC transport system permease protein
MGFFGLVRLAGRSFLRHRLRALLTTLGIVIGVGAFVAMVAIGRGATADVEARIARLGTATLVVSPGATMSGGARGGTGTSTDLTDDDAAAIRRECDQVELVALRSGTRTQVAWMGSNWNTLINGISPEYFKIRSYVPARGALFGAREYEAAAKVCVLGKTVAEQLFGPEDPVGQTIRVGTLSCEVTGVLTSRGSSGDEDQDDRVFMPLTSVRRRLFRNSAPNAVERLYVQARSREAIPRATEQIDGLLRQRYNLAPGDPDGPTVRDLSAIGQVAQETTKTMTLLLAGIAAVSLVVGGIGIMNMMLVSVTERTREIGVRMAIGARGRDVLGQFLLESLLLTLVGGALGLIVGTGAAKALTATMQWPTELDLRSYAIGFGVSALIGVVFGFYPAWRASRLDPIEALRYE